MRRLAGIFLLSSLVFAGQAAAAPPVPDVKALIDDAFIAQTREWLANPIVPLSIKAQNELRGNIDQATIDALDAQWIAERKSDDKPLISATLSAPLSNYLLRIQAQTLGLYTEIFVMDANGLNVGQSYVDVLGKGAPYVTGTRYRITPVVGLLPHDFNPVPEVGEVAAVFETPLDFLMNPANHQTGNAFYRGQHRTYYEMPHNGFRIWGVTAGIIRRLYQTLYESD